MYQKVRSRNEEAQEENIQPGLPKDLDLVCFAQTTWDSEVLPQVLMSRFAADRRVFFVEEPIFEDNITSYYHISMRYTNKYNVIVIVPHLVKQDPKPYLTMMNLVNQFIQEFKIEKYFLWYCTPIALRYSFQLKPELVVYDSIAKHSVTTEIKLWESELLVWSDVVFSMDRNRNSGSDDIWNYVNKRITVAFQQKRVKIIPRPLNQIEWHEVQLTTLEL